MIESSRFKIQNFRFKVTSISILFLLFVFFGYTQETSNDQVLIISDYIEKSKEDVGPRNLVVFDKPDNDFKGLLISPWNKNLSDTIYKMENHEYSKDSFFIISKALKDQLVKEISLNKTIDWNQIDLPHDVSLIEYKDVSILENLKPQKRKVSIFISSPVLFEQNQMAMTFAWNIYGITVSGTPTIQFYKKVNKEWQKYSEIAFGSF